MKHLEYTFVNSLHIQCPPYQFNRESFRKDLTLFCRRLQQFFQKADFLDFDFHVKFGSHD